MTKHYQIARSALISVEELVAAGYVAPGETGALGEVERHFKVRVSAEMVNAMQGADGDAIRHQFIPAADELLTREEELADPIGDRSHSPVKGVVHRYPDRALLTPTHICEVYCRFCFRRETVGGEGRLTDEELDAAIAYIRANADIWEVILTGGDPLVLSPRRLAAILKALGEIEHVQIVRLHTRVPIVAPGKISADLVAALRGFPSTYVVIHTNHAAEITDNVRSALGRLADAGLPLLSQTVLLKNINDSAEALSRLFRLLVRNRVKPYYLHHTDLARGTSHFRVPIAQGQRIMAELRGRLSGLCLPTYVLDIPGGHGKAPIGPGYIDSAGAPGEYRVEDYNGGRHIYRDILTE
ncbi:MAG: lysine-2,3-aminomutase-like protein [Rhizobiaceae bacterium]